MLDANKSGKLTDTERQPQQTLDAVARSVLVIKSPDGQYKSCDDCQAHIPDDTLEVGSQHCSTYLLHNSAIQATMCFIVAVNHRSRYIFAWCEGSEGTASSSCSSEGSLVLLILLLQLPAVYLDSRCHKVTKQVKLADTRCL